MPKKLTDSDLMLDTDTTVIRPVKSVHYVSHQFLAAYDMPYVLMLVYHCHTVVNKT